MTKHNGRNRDERQHPPPAHGDARREATLVLVTCQACDVELAEVPVGAEVRCLVCRSWNRATDARGMLDDA